MAQTVTEPTPSAAPAPTQDAGGKTDTSKRGLKGMSYYDGMQVLSTEGAKKSGQLLVSNNPELVYEPGLLLQGMRLEKGTAALYLHHFNRTSFARHKPSDPLRDTLQYWARVTPAEGAVKVGWNAAETTAECSGKDNTPGTDANAKTARKALEKDAAPLAAGEPLAAGAVRVFPVATAPAGNAGLLTDVRAKLALSGPVKVDIGCRTPGGPTPEAEQKKASGNTKLATSGTHGRGAGVYDAAALTDQQSVDVSRLEGHPVLYPLTGVDGKIDAPLPVAQQQQKASDPKAALVGAKAAKSTDAATLLLLHEVYHVSTRWLEDEIGVTRGGTILPQASWKQSKDDPSYKALVIDLEAKVEAARKSGSWDDVVAHIAANDTIGAKDDACSYGMIFDVTLGLDNQSGDSEAAMKLTLLNANKDPFRGSATIDGRPAWVTKNKPEEGKSAAGVALIDDAKKVPAKGRGAYHFRMMSPGQTSTGHFLKLERKAAGAPKAGPGDKPAGG